MVIIRVFTRVFPSFIGQNQSIARGKLVQQRRHIWSNGRKKEGGRPTRNDQIAEVRRGGDHAKNDV